MMRFLIIAALLFVLAAGLIVFAFPIGTFRYVMTVEVEADGEIYASSSIHEIRIGKNLPITWGRRYSDEFRGEAVAVDIGDRGTLFVLLTGPCRYTDRPLPEVPNCRSDPEDVARAVFDFPETSDAFVRSMSRIEASADAALDDLPMFVTFADLSAPETVQLVDPQDLTNAFGEGARLQRVHLQATRDTITTGIEQKLPWIGSLRGSLDGSTLYHGRTLLNSIGVLDFTRGVMSR